MNLNGPLRPYTELAQNAARTGAQGQAPSPLLRKQDSISSFSVPSLLSIELVYPTQAVASLESLAVRGREAHPAYPCMAKICQESR